MVRNGPWLLSHVCSIGGIATLLPSLWLSLIIQPRLCDLDDQEALLQTILKRSKRSPLSLRLWMRPVLSFLDMPYVDFEISSEECYNEVMGHLLSGPSLIHLPFLQTLQIILGTLPDLEDSEDGSELDKHSISTVANTPILHNAPVHARAIPRAATRYSSCGCTSTYPFDVRECLHRS
ncbi:hypothetical protein IW262DRAFT_1369814 [Armillaria fumosa]|nr:hypothetical protein IW262DRAFT_1369814 [Armillaria fumosa]